MVALNRPETYRLLETVPTLLMYELGTAGPNALWVHHGSVQNIVLQGTTLTFDFRSDPKRAFIDRGVVLSFADKLGIHRLEQYRTHWAIKDGNLPDEIFEGAVATRPERTIAAVAAFYIEAKRDGPYASILDLASELKGFPPSLDKAQALLPALLLNHPTPEIYPVLGIEPKSSAGSAALREVLENAERNTTHFEPSFSLAWFLDEYGGPTESKRKAKTVEQCGKFLRTLSFAFDNGEGWSITDSATALWRCARSSLLVGQLRREIATLIERLVSKQSPNGAWADPTTEGDHTANVRDTALATVALQRLGNDRHHLNIERAVFWLLEQWDHDDESVTEKTGNADREVIGTVMSLEALRRSNLAEEVPYCLADGESWLMSVQTDFGSWVAEPWPEDFVTATVLDYFRRSGSMLPQVDGFLLMARDFFRRAEELGLEGGSNNRRMAAIAAVHAVEMFLYGLFERREDLCLSPFRDKGTETLGPREALGGLQESLQRIGLLTSPQRLKYRDQLASLIGRRDGIIHRAHDISEEELTTGMLNARKFIEHYGYSLIRIDLLQ